MLNVDPEPTGYSWHCLMCNAYGPGGQTGYAEHYRDTHKHGDRMTFMDFLREARAEHKLTGTRAWDWAHSAWVEYENNQ